MKERVHVRIAGRVQGVFFRATTRDRARELGITGWVRNLPDGCVETVAEGRRELLERFVEYCRTGPTFAKVDRVDVRWEDYLAEFSDFRVGG